MNMKMNDIYARMKQVDCKDFANFLRTYRGEIESVKHSNGWLYRTVNGHAIAYWKTKGKKEYWITNEKT